MRQLPIVVMVLLAAVLAIAASRAKVEPYEINCDLSKRDAAEYYDFNVNLLTHLGKPIKLDVLVAPKDFDRKDCWLQSSYYITPDELRGVELLVPKSAVADDGKGHLRVKGNFLLSDVTDSRQGHISLHLLPPK